MVAVPAAYTAIYPCYVRTTYEGLIKSTEERKMKKKCPKCDQIKDIKCFWKGDKKYKRDHYCILCRKEYKKEHKYTDYQRKYKRKWEKENKEKILLYRKRTTDKSVQNLLPRYLKQQVSLTEKIPIREVTEEQMKEKKKSILLYRKLKRLRNLEDQKKPEQLIEVEEQILKLYVPGNIITSPCMKCEFKDKDKNREECRECDLRVEYVKNL